MSNSEKMKRLREKLLDAGLNGTVEDARLCAEALGMMPPEDDGARNVGSNAAPPAAAVKQAKEMLAREGWVVLDHLHSADDVLRFLKRDGVRQPLPSFQETLDALKAVKPPEPAGETLHRTKREGIDLFMGQGFPRFDSALFGVIRGDEDHLVTVLKNRSGVGPLLRWMSPAEFAAADVIRAKEAATENEATHWFVPNAVTVAANAFAYCPEGRRVLAPGGSVFKTLYSPGMKVRTPIPLKRETDNACDFFGIATLCRRGYGEEPEAGFSQHGRIYATKMIAETACGTTPDPIAWLVPYAVAHPDRAGTTFDLTGKRFYSTRTGSTYEALSHEPFSVRTPIPVVVVKGPIAFGHANLQSSLIAGVSADAEVFETRDQAERSCAGLDAAPAAEPTPTYWFVADAPVNLTPGKHEVVSDGGLSLTTLPVGEVGSFGRKGRGPIGLRSEVCSANVITHVEDVKWTLYQRTGLSAHGRVFDSIVSARAHLAELPAPQKTGDWLNPVEADAIGRPSFHGSYTAEKPLVEPVATHWFVPATAFAVSEAGHRVTQNGSSVAFYSLASDREADRSPIPLRLDPSQAGHGSLVGVWRLYKPGVSVAGVVCPTLNEAKAHSGFAEPAPAPKKVRYGMLDASVAGPSALTIVETADGIPVAITVRDFAPGPLLGTMLHVVAMCFRLGITDLYGDSYREKEVTHALATIATFLRGEALHDLSEGDRASFLRTTTTIEWPRAYTIPTFKALPPLS